MLPFLHHRLQRSVELLEQANAALGAHLQGDPSAAGSIDEFLAAMTVTYDELGLAVGANEAQALRAQYASARRGYPLGECRKVTSDRRGLERAVGLTVLSMALDRLRADVERDQARLDEGCEQLRVLILHGLRVGVVPSDTAPGADADAIWKALLAEPGGRPLAQQVAMRLSATDIRLLLVELILLLSWTKTDFWQPCQSV